MAAEKLNDQLDRIIPAKEDILSLKSTSGGSQRVTLSSGTGTGPNIACQFCRIQAHSGNDDPGRVRIGATCTAITGVAVPGNPVLTPYSVSNLNLLNFFNTDQDAIYDIEYFNQ